MPDEPPSDHLDVACKQQLTQESARVQISVVLPIAIVEAISSYEKFKKKNDSLEPQEFKNFHGACIAALKHIETLIKLSVWANVTAAPDNDDAFNKLEKIIMRAQQELNEHNDIIL